MNTITEETRDDGKQRRKSIGSGGGLTVSGGKTRRNSIGITSSRKSIGDEGNVVPNYLRASTGSCHDFCKYGHKHELAKSAIPIKYKRSTTVVGKKKVTDPQFQTPVESTKKDVSISLPSKKTQTLKRVSPINGKPKENEVKIGQRPTSNVKMGAIKKKDVKTVKKTEMPPKSQSSKASLAANLKTTKHRNVKQVSPLKDQNRMRKIEVKQNELESEAKNVGIVDSIPFPSMELIKDPVSRDGSEKESMITNSVFESSELFQEKELPEDSSMVEVLEMEKSESFSEVLEQDSFIPPPISESSQSFYDDEEDESEFSDDEVSEEDSEDIKRIPRKGRMVISEEKDEEGVKLRFRRGKILEVQQESNGPRRLKFRKGKVLEGNEERREVSRRSYESKYEKKEKKDSENGHESVVLKHQGEQEKKDGQGLFNNVIEETASKLVESRKSKVKALVGAFETVISLQDGKP